MIILFNKYWQPCKSSFPFLLCVTVRSSYPGVLRVCVFLVTIATGVLLLAEQLGGAVGPRDQGPSPVPPAIFREVGPSVDDWETYLRKLSDNLDKQQTSTDISSEPTRQEDKLFLQVNGFFFLGPNR